MPFQIKKYREGSSKYDLFKDLESGSIYRRIYCGFSWPMAAAPGFICVLGEDFKQDFSLPLSPRHVRVLAEFESSNLETLHRSCRQFREEFNLKHILGSEDTPLFEIWNQSKESDQRVYLSSPYDFEKITLDLISQLVRRHTERGYKTLHFGGQSRLPSYLSGLTSEEVQKNDIQCHPAIAAFGYCLCEMEFRKPQKVSKNWKRRNRSAMAV